MSQFAVNSACSLDRGGLMQIQIGERAHAAFKFRRLRLINLQTVPLSVAGCLYHYYILNNWASVNYPKCTDGESSYLGDNAFFLLPSYRLLPDFDQKLGREREREQSRPAVARLGIANDFRVAGRTTISFLLQIANVAAGVTLSARTFVFTCRNLL